MVKSAGKTGVFGAFGFLVAIALYITVGVSPAAAATDQFEITLSTDGSCGATGTDTLTVPSGTDVTFCYSLENTEATELQIDHLISDTFGEFEDDLNVVLDPGETFEYLFSTEVNTTVSESATWTPIDQGGQAFPATATATATLQLDPTSTVTFSDPTLLVGQTGIVTATYTNPNPVPLNDLNMRIRLGTPLDISPGDLTNNCPDPAGGPAATEDLLSAVEVIEVEGFALPANSSCTVTLNYVADQPGTYLLEGNHVSFYHDTTPDVSNDNNRTDYPDPLPVPTITVNPTADPTSTVTFSDPTLLVGQTGIVTATYTNPNPVPLNDLNMRIRLGTPLDISPGDLTNNCPDPAGGPAATEDLLSAVEVIEVEGFALPANSSCTVTLNYVADQPGTYLLEGNHVSFYHDTTPDVSNDNNRTDYPDPLPVPTITVNPTADPTSTVTFSDPTLLVGQTGIVTATYTNPNPVPLNDLNMRIRLGTPLDISPGDLTNNCPDPAGGPAATEDLLSAVEVIEVEGFALPANSSCTVTLNYVADQPGTYLLEGNHVSFYHDTTPDVSNDNNRTDYPDPLPVPTITVNPVSQLDVTLSLDGSCGPIGTDQILVSIGTTVTICYRLENVGPNELQIDHVSSTTFGSFEDDLDLVLQTGDTFEYLMSTVASATIDESATWTPVDQGGQSFGVTASATIEVLGLSTPLSPDGTVSAVPEFRWTEANGATDYRLWIQSTTGAGVVHDVVHSVGGELTCTNGECAIAPAGLLLADDSYRWWIRPQYPTGNGSWSTALNFTLGAAAVVPDQVTLIAPTGAGISSTPEFVWDEDTNATQYRLWIQSTDGQGIVHDAIHTTNDLTCTNAQCAITPAGLTLSGSYQWWVQAQSPAGNGQWSAPLSFAAATAVPGPVTLVAPSGAGVSATPEFVWNEDSDASHYRLWVQSTGGQGVVHDTVHSVGADVTCAGGQCSITPAGLTLTGNYRWWVQAQSAAGNAPWSTHLDFVVAGASAPDATTLLAPTGAGAGTNPTYTWNAVDGATWYRLWVDDSTGSQAVLQWFTADQAGCANGESTCAAAPTAPVSGASTFWVRTWNSVGYGPWSTPLAFNTN